MKDSIIIIIGLPESVRDKQQCMWRATQTNDLSRKTFL